MSLLYPHRRKILRRTICLQGKYDLIWSVLNFWGEEEDLWGRSAERGLSTAHFFPFPIQRQERRIATRLTILLVVDSLRESVTERISRNDIAPRDTSNALAERVHH